MNRIVATCIAATGFAWALAGHAHEDEGVLGRAPEKLGKVNFPTSCTPAVQEKFQRGVALLHSFWYSEGEKTFQEIMAAEPDCAIAAWGYASILMSNALAGIGASPKGAEQARAALEQARRTGAKTERERDYLEAVGAYYADFASRPESARQASRAAAYEELAARYPDDDEAQIFYALYLAGTQSRTDQSYSVYLKSASILDRQFVKYPDHPGIAHYLIHVFDAPPIAKQGLDAARRYAGIAPSAPHALHMPSHVFTRVGAWVDSADTNRRSAIAGLKGNEPDEAMHAYDYMTYAYLQLARDADARKVLEDSAKVSGTNTARSTAPYAAAAMAARVHVERGDWKAAAQLQPRASRFPYTEAMTHFARALGAARSGDPAGAEKDIQQLALLRDALQAAKDAYWAAEVETSRTAAAAWTAFAQGRRDEGLALMRAAADSEDKREKHIVTPGRILPARELLGDMLLEAGRPADALAEYEASQVREPNRFRGFHGAARAAEAAGDKAKARRYYGQLLELAAKGDARPEIAAARRFIAAN